MKVILLVLALFGTNLTFSAEISGLLGHYKLVKADVNLQMYRPGSGVSPCENKLKVFMNDQDELVFYMGNLYDESFGNLNQGKVCRDLNSSETFGGVQCRKNKYDDRCFKSFSCIRGFISGFGCILSIKPKYRATLNQNNILEIVKPGHYKCQYQPQ